MKSQRVGVVVFLFGIPGEIFSNAIIKKIAEEISCRENAIIFSQRGIHFEFGFDVEYANGNSESPTLKIAEQAAEWAWRKGIGKIIVVAASPHISRCARDIEASLKMKSVLPVKVLKCAEAFMYDGLWFRKESEQFRTRHRFYWNIREWILTRLPFPIYRRAAN